MSEPAPPPPVARQHAELRAATAGTQVAGFALAALGVVAALLRGTVLPALPELVPVVLIVTALGLMLLGSVRRARYHLRRVREGRR